MRYLMEWKKLNQNMFMRVYKDHKKTETILLLIRFLRFCASYFQTTFKSIPLLFARFPVSSVSHLMESKSLARFLTHWKAFHTRCHVVKNLHCVTLRDCIVLRMLFIRWSCTSLDLIIWVTCWHYKFVMKFEVYCGQLLCHANSTGSLSFSHFLKIWLSLSNKTRGAELCILFKMEINTVAGFMAWSRHNLVILAFLYCLSNRLCFHSGFWAANLQHNSLGICPAARESKGI